MGDDQLKMIAHELLTSLRSNLTVDGSHRESARARMHVLVKRILRGDGYLPNLADASADGVGASQAGVGQAGGVMSTPPICRRTGRSPCGHSRTPIEGSGPPKRGRRGRRSRSRMPLTGIERATEPRLPRFLTPPDCRGVGGNGKQGGLGFMAGRLRVIDSDQSTED